MLPAERLARCDRTFARRFIQLNTLASVAHPVLAEGGLAHL
jgi:hypothetical protein